MAARFAGLILAGGRGERYGGPKAFARLPDGRAFWLACDQALASAGADPVVITLPFDCDQSRVDAMRIAAERADGATSRLILVPLPVDGLAMFESLVVGLSHALARSGWSSLLILPVDHPLVGPETIAALGRAGAGAALPSFRGKHGHPVAISRAVAARIVGGELRGPTLRDVLRVVDRVDVVVDDAGVVANCNSPDRLAQAWALSLGSSRGPKPSF
jgi:molybdenum cofactor cytidylyltransferase